jgi:hypothetical protein
MAETNKRIDERTASAQLILFAERSSSPDTPGSGTGTIYEKTDGRFYCKNDAGTETLIDLVGDTVGPGSATDNAVVIFDGTTGKLIKDSTKLLPSGAIIGATDTQTLTNKTLTAPSIADLSNSQHSHANAAGGGTVAHTNLTSIGSNTHAQIDTHIGSTSNPHTVTKTQLSLGNVTNDSQLKRAAADFASFAAKTTPVSADILLIEDSADSNNKKKITIGTLPGGGSSRWTTTTAFTGTPASTSTITTTSDLTGLIKIGYPLRYTIGGTVYYGIVTAITSSLITLAGASLTSTITALAYGDPARVQNIPIVVNGYYADANNTALLSTDLLIPGGLVWLLGDAYVVQVAYRAAVIDTGATKEKINITIGGSDLLTADVSVSASLTKSVINILTANYSITTGEAIEIDVTKGTNGNAHDLVVYLTVVFP